jgi:predicted ATP-grasp superfamily ATP-dependent carboligase
VLLTAEELFGGLAAVRALRAAGHEPWVVRTRPERYAPSSRAAAGVIDAPDPAADPAGFAHELAAAAERLGAAAVLPGSEDALVALAGREALFTDGVAVGTCAPETVERAVDKRAMFELAMQAGLEVPATRVTTVAALRATPETLPYPVVVKPARTKLADVDGRMKHRRVKRVASHDELPSALESFGDGAVLVEPCLPGRLRAVSGVAWDGELVCASHQVARRIWPLDVGGSSYAVTIPPDPGLESAVSRLVELLGWSGVFQAQFLDDGERAVLIDFNPRIYGSLALAVAAGLNLPAVWVELLRGGRASVAGYRAGVYYRAEGNDLRVFLAHVRRLRWADAAPVLVPRRRTVHALVSVRDPAPLLSRVTTRLLRR